MSGIIEALVLIDLQEAFLEPPGVREHRDELLAHAAELAAAARRHHWPIFLVSTEHSRDMSTWTLAMREAEEGFLFHGDPGTKIVTELDTRGMTRIEKTRDSAFFGTDLLLRVHNLGIRHLCLAGVSTHACVVQTARDAYANNVRASVLTDVVADADPELARMGLELLDADGQAVLETGGEVLARGEGRSTRPGMHSADGVKTEKEPTPRGENDARQGIDAQHDQEVPAARPGDLE
jgi:nicotinamidase-related amidase